MHAGDVKKELSKPLFDYVKTLYGFPMRTKRPGESMGHKDAQDIAQQLKARGHSFDQTVAILKEIQPDKGSAWKQNYEKWMMQMMQRQQELVILYSLDPELQYRDPVLQELQRLLQA